MREWDAQVSLDRVDRQWEVREERATWPENPGALGKHLVEKPHVLKDLIRVDNIKRIVPKRYVALRIRHLDMTGVSVSKCGSNLSRRASEYSSSASTRS